jgi:hypothetical protein
MSLESWMSTFEKTLAMEDFTRGNLFQTAKPCTFIRLGGYLQKSVAYPVRLGVHFSRLDMLTPVSALDKEKLAQEVQQRAARGRKGGRPRAKAFNTPEKIAYAQALYDQGKSVPMICGLLHCTPATLYRYIQTTKEADQ